MSTELPVMNSNEEILRRFSFHPATPVTGPLHDQMRQHHGDLAALILALVPAGRHRSAALTSLQESMMWCNAAIANDTPPYDPDRDPLGEPPEPGTPVTFG